MRRIVFYSWQSDLPNATNRGFIQTALGRAAKSIAADDSVAIEPVIDRDTAGVPGSPDIAGTIFAKIAAADVVVVDVSIVCRPESGRPAPNPNVLVELGYAIRAVGYERLILVFNEAYGKVEELPFDLRARRVTVYSMSADEKERAKARTALEAKLDSAIRAALDHAPAPVAPTNQALIAIEEVRPNRVIVLRKELADLFARIDAIKPKVSSAGGTLDDLLAAIDASQEAVADFSKLTETVAVMNDAEIAGEVYRWFAALLERYDLPAGFSGTYNEADFDFFKFVGHELFVTFMAYLIRENRWQLLTELLNGPIPMRYLRTTGGAGNASWSDLSEHIALLLGAGRQRGRLSVHADKLAERHGKGGLGTLMPLEDFVAADFFLYLRGELPAARVTDLMKWRPWGTLYLRSAPAFLLRAQQKSFAEHLIKAVGVPSIADFKQRLAERAPRLRELFSGGHWRLQVPQEVIDKIGTQ